MGAAIDSLRPGELRRLVFVFVAWKTLLVSLTAVCPGPGYDTSGLILFGGSKHRHIDFLSLSLLDRTALKFLRWDAHYFVVAAQRGHVYEQEWAFSWAYSNLLRASKNCKVLLCNVAR